jgi:FKBP-type peptidyl-prolyl cis-trans isomerase
MKRILALLALTILTACGQTQSSVVDEIERREAAEKRVSDVAATEAQGFIAEKRQRPGVQSMPSGLAYEFVRHSRNDTLARPDMGATVQVHYEGSLPSGEVFDSSIARGEPATFPMRGVIPGFSEALTLMRPGDELIAYIPPELGYGAAGSPPKIPPNSPLVFRLQLLAFQDASGRTVHE